MLLSKGVFNNDFVTYHLTYTVVGPVICTREPFATSSSARYLRGLCIIWALNHLFDTLRRM